MGNINILLLYCREWQHFTTIKIIKLFCKSLYVLELDVIEVCLKIFQKIEVILKIVRNSNSYTQFCVVKYTILIKAVFSERPTETNSPFFKEQKWILSAENFFTNLL